MNYPPLKCANRASIYALRRLDFEIGNYLRLAVVEFFIDKMMRMRVAQLDEVNYKLFRLSAIPIYRISFQVLWDYFQLRLYGCDFVAKYHFLAQALKQRPMPTLNKQSGTFIWNFNSAFNCHFVISRGTRERKAKPHSDLLTFARSDECGDHGKIHYSVDVLGWRQRVLQFRRMGCVRQLKTFLMANLVRQLGRIRWLSHGRWC